jgi:hypothetical protein
LIVVIGELPPSFKLADLLITDDPLTKYAYNTYTKTITIIAKTIVVVSMII